MCVIWCNMVCLYCVVNMPGGYRPHGGASPLPQCAAHTYIAVEVCICNRIYLNVYIYLERDLDIYI